MQEKINRRFPRQKRWKRNLKGGWMQGVRLGERKRVQRNRERKGARRKINEIIGLQI